MAVKGARDVVELRELLLWARANRIVLGQVTIGAVTVTVTDLGMKAPSKPLRRQTSEYLATMAGTAAGAMREAGVLEREDDDDDEAAVQ